MSIDSVDICIMGSGVAGLAAAVLLQNSGFKVRVYEKDNDFVDRRQGYGMTLTYSINGPLSKLDILNECIDNNCASHCHYTFNPKGDVLGYFGRELKNAIGLQQTIPETQGGNRGNLRIPRQDLRMMLLRKLHPNTVYWGRSFYEYIETEDGVTVTLQNHNASCGTSEIVLEKVKAYVFVGADGIRSKVREMRDMKLYAEVPCPLRYMGVAVIIGLSTCRHALIDERGFYIVDGVHRMFTMPYISPHNCSSRDKDGSASTCATVAAQLAASASASTSASASAAEVPQSGLTMWQLSFSGLDEDQANVLRKLSASELIAEALRRTAGWFEPVGDMLRHTLPTEVWSTGL
jgi:2-polyprenyl-6-methoxyphenol hydroxylase-like FAD-dependent oxidoreductase